METDNTNQQVPPVQNIAQPQSAPLPNPSSHSRIFIIVLGVVILVVIGIGSYLLGTRKNQTVVQNQQITTSPTVTQPSPTPNPTANWKTYTSTKYGFGIKYPLDFKTSDLSRGDKSAWAVDFYKAKDVSVSGPADPYIGPAIIILNRNVDFCEYCEGFDTEEIIVNGYYAVQSSRVNGNSLWVYSKDRQRVVRINYGFNSEEEKALMNQILSTFKFTNQYKEFDGKVWADVNQITTAINLYYAETKRLPKSLEELTSLPSLSFFTLNKNPITGKPYVYTPYGDGKGFVVSGTQSDGTEYTQEISIK